MNILSDFEIRINREVPCSEDYIRVKKLNEAIRDKDVIIHKQALEIAALRRVRKTATTAKPKPAATATAKTAAKKQSASVTAKTTVKKPVAATAAKKAVARKPAATATAKKAAAKKPAATKPATKTAAGKREKNSVKKR